MYKGLLNLLTLKIEGQAVNIKSETMKHYIYISISTPYLINIQLMFGSQTNMNHQRPYANFKEIQTNTSRLQFFSSLFNNNQITYLDPHKIYCVIQTERYTKIKEELSQSLRNQQSLEKVAYEMNLANIGLKKEIQIYTQQTQKLKASQRQMKQEYNNAIKASKQYEKSFLEFKCRANQNIFQQSTEIKSKLATKTYTNQYCQTQALLSQQEKAQENSIINNEIEVPQQEKVDQKLYELLRLEMDKFQQQFQAKVHEIEQAKLNIEKWQTENQSLREQNQNLKNKIVERDIQQQKLKIWKVNVNEFVSRIEQSITHPAPKHSQPLPSQQSNESVSYLKAEVLELRGKIVEMRNKMRRIDESIEIQGEINDDGAIGMLVRTSQKLKQLVKGIIADVEQI